MSQKKTNLKLIHQDVSDLLSADKSGHGIDHIDRVYRIAMDIARQEGADLDEVALTVYLHDVDDYKLFGKENAEKLTNARKLLDRYEIDKGLAERVLKNIATMGYSKSLEGVRPTSLEGQVVSDADMCDAIGAQGLIRVFEYNASKGRPFFVASIKPVGENFTAEQYRVGGNDHAVQHFFDKLLKIPGILMTESGREEGRKRAEIMEQYLRELFREEGAEEWLIHLDAFLGCNLTAKND